MVLRCGVSIFEYWEMTIGEMYAVIEAYKANIELNNRRDYNLATMIASFVNCGLNGKEFPAFDKLFGIQAIAKPVADAATMLYMEQWKDFADRRNKQLKEQKQNDLRGTEGNNIS